MRPPKKGSKGENHMTWRNAIAHKAMKEKEPGTSENPKRIKRRWNRYQDQNFIQNVQALKTFFPESLRDLQDIVKAAAKKGLKVKAVGSGHSFSDIMTTSDYLVTTDFLQKVLMDYPKDGKSPKIKSFPLLKEDIIKKGYSAHLKKAEKAKIDSCLNQEAKDRQFKEIDDRIDKLNPSLYEIEAGIKIETLNETLWNDGFSLQNMGTYQGQSFIGAVSTSTHGSGINLGPLPDMIKSILIVAENGITYRIEPDDGISRRLEPLKTYDKENTEIKRLVQEEKIFLPSISRKDLLSSFKKPKYLYTDKLGDHYSAPFTKSPTFDFDYLVQDDHWFNSTLVNVGCFGVVYSVIIEVVPSFYLLETVELELWSRLKKRLAMGVEGCPDLFLSLPSDEGKKSFPKDLCVSDIYQMEVNIHPHNYQGDNFCRITRRYKLKNDIGKMYSEYEIWYNSDGTIMKKIPISRGDNPKGVLRYGLNRAAEKVKETIEAPSNILSKSNNPIAIRLLNKAILRKQGVKPRKSIKTKRDLGDRANALLLGNKEKEVKAGPFHDPGYYVNRNYLVYINPTVGISGYGVETAFSMKEKYKLNFNGKEEKEEYFAYITAVDHSLKLADQHLAEGKFTQTAPTSLRFVKKSRAYLSPQYGEATVMIEMLNLADTHGGKELFYRYQSQLFQYGGRPHWGLDLSVTTGNNNLLGKMYPKFKCWKAVYDTLNANGTFNNRFTDRMGLSIQNFHRDHPKEE